MIDTLEYWSKPLILHNLKFPHKHSLLICYLMSKIQEKLYKKMPAFLQNCLVTLFDYIQYKRRRGGNYRFWYNEVIKQRNFSIEEIQKLQEEKLSDFIDFARNNSPYYKRILPEKLADQSIIEYYNTLPIQSKEDIRSNIKEIYTINAENSIISKTGGTTGKSLEVRYTHDNMQERQATLDFFRKEHGYSIGKKVAWFSGKAILTEKDVKKKRYWRYDWYYKIRYYSTFHISPNSIKHYIDNLNQFQPEFLVGFPSSMYEIAKWGLANNHLLKYNAKTIFPTAETIVEHEKNTLKEFFGAEVRNQYASSEGAPFILECSKGNLHIELLSGYLEVMDPNNKPVKEGDLVFTSFQTHGTPLIRYAIKDQLTLSDRTCNCGNPNPLAESIEGRINDFIYSEERGKINLGNVSNCVKYVIGVVKFQIIQDSKNAIEVNVVKDGTYTQKDEDMFRKELVERLGNAVAITFQYRDDIPREKSGKYRIIKNSLQL